jgi:serine/threonine-protein kinase HipA
MLTNVLRVAPSLDDVAYTPVYDLITTQAYDGLRDTAPGLTIEGRRSWSPGKSLPKFFSSRLGIPQRRYQEMLDELCDAAVSTARELVALSRDESAWQSIVKYMLWAWDCGIQDVRRPNSTVSLGPVLQEAGFADYDRPAPAPRTGESPLLGKRRSSRRVRKRKDASPPSEGSDT